MANKFTCTVCGYSSDLVRHCGKCKQPVCALHRYPAKADGVLCRECAGVGSNQSDMFAPVKTLPDLPEVRFTTNWNNKLQCHCFSSIRPWNPGKYTPGTRYLIRFVDKTNEDKIDPFEAVLVTGHSFDLDRVPEITAALDTGYSREETINIMRKMYDNADNIKFGIYLFKRV